MRSFTATVLSLWLGVLACLLGCASPAKAGQSQTASVQCTERDDTGDSCCQRGHHPGRSAKNHHALSCCPTETALTQKQNLTLPALAIFVVVSVPAHLIASPLDFNNSSSGETNPWQAGRGFMVGGFGGGSHYGSHNCQGRRGGTTRQELSPLRTPSQKALASCAERQNQPLTE
jgi:hypothetical protein